MAIQYLKYEESEKKHKLVYGELKEGEQVWGALEYKSIMRTTIEQSAEKPQYPEPPVCVIGTVKEISNGRAKVITISFVSHGQLPTNINLFEDCDSYTIMSSKSDQDNTD